MSKVAIVAAMEREVRPLVKEWRVSQKEYAGRRYSFFENDDVVLVCGGIGPDAARRAAEAVIAQYGPSIIYSAGFAGALAPELKIGDIVRPARVVDAGDGSSVAIAAGAGVLVSFASVASPEQKAKLRRSYAAQAVDMEATAVARAAEARGIAFAAVKVISDRHDFLFPPMDRFVDFEGRFHDARFALFAALRPWLWLKVVRIARNSNHAARALSDWLRRADLGKADRTKINSQKMEADEKASVNSDALEAANKE